MRYKVGRYTTGLTFVAIGVLVLLQQVTDVNWLGQALKFWPLVIIGYGLEYLLAARKPERTRFDFGGAFFIAFLLIIISVYSFFSGFIFNFKDMQYTIVSDKMDVTSEVHSIDVENLFGDVIVEASKDKNITIHTIYRSNKMKTSEKIKEEVGLTTSVQSGKLIIKGHQLLGRNNGLNFFGLAVSGVDLHIYAPPEIATSITNHFGGIEIRGMQNVRSLEQNFGDIDVYDVKGDVRIKSDFGDVNLRNYTGGINVKSSFGEVNVDGDIQGTWDIDNDFGTVKLSLPKESSYHYRFNVDFGSRDVPNPPFTNKESGSINGGTHQLRVDVSFGSIEVDLK